MGVEFSRHQGYFGRKTSQVEKIGNFICRWEDNIKMAVGEIWFEGVDWI